MDTRTTTRKSRYSGKNFSEKYSINQIPADKWSDAKLSPEQTYTVELFDKYEDLIPLVNSIFSSMTTDKCSLDDCKCIAIIAHHLFDNIEKKMKRILPKNYPDGRKNIGEYSTLHHAPSVTKKRVIRKVTRPMTDEERKMEKEALAAQGKNLSPFDENSIEEEKEFEEEVPIPKRSGAAKYHIADMSENDVRFGVYLISSTIKIIGKSEDNLVKSWSKIMENYHTFYDGDEITMDIPTPSKQWFSRLKSKFNTDSTVTKTIIRLVVYLEDHLGPETSTAGLIRYLWCLPLSYSGMHAYKLFMSNKYLTGASVSWLLDELTHPTTVGALDEIAMILSEFELTDTNKKSTGFRYARLVGPQYFQPLQTKACPSLVYCLASLMNKFLTSNLTFKADDIYGVKDLATDVKTYMSTAADKIYLRTHHMSEDLYSESMRQAATELDSHKDGLAGNTEKPAEVFNFLSRNNPV